MNDTKPAPFAKLAPIADSVLRDGRADSGANASPAAAMSWCRAWASFSLKSSAVRFLGNFEVAAGIVEGKHRGPKWNDGDFYKWLEAAAAVYALSRNAKLGRQMDEIIALIARTQLADGYIHTDVQIAAYGESKERFGNPMDFEMYNMGHLMSAAFVHHRVTGKTSLLAVARKSADYLACVFANPTPAMARHGICPANLHGACRSLPRGRRAKVSRPGDQAPEHARSRHNRRRRQPGSHPLPPARTAHGHAVRATSVTPVPPMFMQTPATHRSCRHWSRSGRTWFPASFISPADAARFRGAAQWRRSSSRSRACTRRLAVIINCRRAPRTTKPAAPSATCSGTGECCSSPAKRPRGHHGAKPFQQHPRRHQPGRHELFYTNTLRSSTRCPCRCAGRDIGRSSSAAFVVRRTSCARWRSRRRMPMPSAAAM